MEQIPININISWLSLCLSRILLWDIRTKGFLSFFLFCFHSLWNSVSTNWKTCTKSRSYSNPETMEQSLKCIQHGVRLCKEEVILIIENLGVNVEEDGEGIEEFGEQEIALALEKEPTFAEVEEAFNVFDENKDGFIEAKELQRVLRLLGLEKDLVQCQRMINVVDQNGDELIDHNEFVKLIEQSFG
ncbi:PREDICTED: probable calcium-binding protein CML45 [Lupinus angustifolius]|nr:PREDICTED: probable calcium-binding protein CML45 [Lupinus angustifolius]